MESFFGWFAGFFDQIWQSLSSVMDFFMEFVVSLKEFVKASLVFLFKQLIYLFMYLAHIALVASWEVAQELLNDFGVIQLLESAYNKLDADIRSVLNYLNIPQVVGILLSAFGTRLTLRFAPFGSS